MRIRWIAALLLLFTPSLSQAQELSLLLGAMKPSKANESTYSWQLDFRYEFNRYLAASISYLNEGHITDHHRDGIPAQLWGRIPLFRHSLSLDLGAGAYRYYDTQPHGNAHGWAPIYSFAATVYTDTPWYFRAQANLIRPPNDIDTSTYMLGVGYRLWKQKTEPAWKPAPQAKTPSLVTGDEVMAFGGETVANNFRHPKGVAAGLEFRKGLVHHLDWTLTWLFEGNPEVTRRNSVASQVWLVDAYFDRRFTAGLGVGPYLVVDRKNTRATREPGQDAVGPLVTLGVSYRFAPHLFTRVNFNRLVGGPNRDSDVFMFGVGYRWNG